MDKTKYSVASKKRWAGVPKEKRVKIMRKLAKKRQAMLSPSQKRKNALRLVKARLLKKTKNNDESNTGTRSER